MFDRVLRRVSAFLVSFGIVACTVAILSATASVRADDPIQPGIVTCGSCPVAPPCGSPAPDCTASGNAVCGSQLCDACKCQPNATATKCQCE